MDCCGTGGDNSNSLNVSTAVAFMLAACGVKIAKHGNRAVTSQSGSSDVLAALGINTEAPREIMEKSLLENNLAFIQAPLYHPALARLAAIRKKIGKKTIFNLLGPLCNPANVKLHLLGVYDAGLCRIMAEALLKLGSKSAWVVNGGGMDEISISGTSNIACLHNGIISEFSISPSDAGLTEYPAEALAGGSADYNAAAMVDLFSGIKSAYRDAVLLNSAAGLVIAGKAASLKNATAIAAEAIDSGKALMVLERIRKTTTKENNIHE
jgi:anthranilate phosphoribosyltransferase